MIATRSESPYVVCYSVRVNYRPRTRKIVYGWRKISTKSESRYLVCYNDERSCDLLGRSFPWRNELSAAFACGVLSRRRGCSLDAHDCETRRRMVGRPLSCFVSGTACSRLCPRRIGLSLLLFDARSHASHLDGIEARE